MNCTYTFQEVSDDYEPRVDQRFLEPLESMALAMEVKQIPLLVIREQDQWPFVQQITKLIGGTTLYSTASDTAAQFLGNIGGPDYLFLLIEEPLQDAMYEIVRYYLESRDILGTMDARLQTKFKNHPIHLDHRLILLVDRQVFAAQPASIQQHLSEFCRIIVVR